MRGPPVRPGSAGDFFVSAGRGARGANVGPVHAPQLPVDTALVIELHLQRFDDRREDTGAPPFGEVPMYGLAGAEAFRQIAPWGASGQNPQDSV